MSDEESVRELIKELHSTELMSDEESVVQRTN